VPEIIPRMTTNDVGVVCRQPNVPDERPRVLGSIASLSARASRGAWFDGVAIRSSQSGCSSGMLDMALGQVGVLGWHANMAVGHPEVVPGHVMHAHQAIEVARVSCNACGEAAEPAEARRSRRPPRRRALSRAILPDRVDDELANESTCVVRSVGERGLYDTGRRRRRRECMRGASE
jgi:hypothetical protein